MPTRSIEIVAKLIPRLASNHDGEVIATVRAIDRTLKADRLDWHDLTRALTTRPLPRSGYSPPCRSESAEATRIRMWLETVSREPWPNDWTQKFIARRFSPPVLGSTVQKAGCLRK